MKLKKLIEKLIEIKKNKGGNLRVIMADGVSIADPVFSDEYYCGNSVVITDKNKFQKVAGSVDEKLQTCDFKRKQYAKLMAPLNIEVEYIYILSDWFKKLEYKDVLDYIISVGYHYYFEYLPLQKLGLPVPQE